MTIKRQQLNNILNGTRTKEYLTEYNEDHYYVIKNKVFRLSFINDISFDNAEDIEKVIATINLKEPGYKQYLGTTTGHACFNISIDESGLDYIKSNLDKFFDTEYNKYVINIYEWASEHIELSNLEIEGE